MGVIKEGRYVFYFGLSIFEKRDYSIYSISSQSPGFFPATFFETVIPRLPDQTRSE
jgi:hypothetical protein